LPIIFRRLWREFADYTFDNTNERNKIKCKREGAIQINKHKSVIENSKKSRKTKMGTQMI